MAKYSSDSDCEQSTNKHRRKHTRRSSSLDSSDSSSYKKQIKYCKIRKYSSRSRSKDRFTKNYKYSRCSSKERRRYRFQKSRSTSGERPFLNKRSCSTEKTASRSTSFQSNIKLFNSDKQSSTSKGNQLSNEIKVKASTLDEINKDEFIPKQFHSSVKNNQSKTKNVIDMNDDTIIRVPLIMNASINLNSIFHTSIMVDKEAKFEKWVKKLYMLRQKVINE